MKTTVSLYDFREAFRTMGRAEQFSYEGLDVLFDYFEQYEEDTGEELELDVIALCCDFYEDEQAGVVREYLEDNGAFVGAVTGGFVYRAF